jgi:hypothetical protein
LLLESVVVAASVDGVDVGLEKGEVMAVLAFPYAEETAVPIDENCPFTALVVDASVPATPVLGVFSPPILRVGQIEDFIPGDVVHPTEHIATTTHSVSFNDLRMESEVSMFGMT